MGKEYSVPTFLQFVPGYCVEVVHSQQSLGYKGPSTINTIYAVSHVADATGKRRQQYYSEDNRYFPLLRNHGDVPTKGDPVLLCTIGKINYYLGPLNMITNSPTWNDDKNYKKELTMGNQDMERNTQRGERGESLNFNKELEAKHDHMEKERKPDLDYGPVINEVTGDYIIEGRHGNSVRVGSRSNNPYIFISNERGHQNYVETLGDGSLITITSKGTIAQHFPKFIDNVNNESEEVFGFTLASDNVDNNINPIGDAHSELNNNGDIQLNIYGYDGNQMLLHSDRITLNSKLDDIFISSHKDIHIGSAENLSISTNKQIVISSTQTKFGKDASEPMVMGNQLVDLLTSIVSMFSEVQSPPGLQGGPLIPSPNLSTVQSKIDQFLSNKHFIDE